jgi:probable F420-dependent oxidoreductase
MSRPFRFAVQSFAASTPAEWRERARRAEGLGYSALHLADHYIGPGPAIAATGHPVQQLAAVPAMTVAAEATSTLRVGCRVFCVDYRPIAVLAKEAATIDFFSEGRLELGLGAGWLQGEYEAMGLAMDPAPVRIARLAESVGAMKALLSGDEVAVQGEHVRLGGFAGVPVPASRPPIMIGGGGRRVLELAAREADIVSLNFDNRSGRIGPAGVQSGTAERTSEKVDWVRSAAAAAGRPVPELEIGAYFTVVGPDPSAAAAGLGQMFGLPPEEVARHPHCLLGDVEAIVEELQRRRESFGVSYVTVPDTALEAFAPVVARLAGT